MDYHGYPPLSSAQRAMMMQQRQQQQLQAAASQRSAMLAARSPPGTMQMANFAGSPPQTKDDAPAATISSDHAGGSAAQEEKGLRDLFNPSSNLPAPNPVLMPSIPSSSPYSFPHPTNGHAFQDHQMQLMLLERQNRKRLMMAREVAQQEMDSAVLPPPAGLDPNRFSAMQGYQNGMQASERLRDEMLAKNRTSSLQLSTSARQISTDQSDQTSNRDESRLSSPEKTSDQTLGKRDASSQDEEQTACRKRPFAGDTDTSGNANSDSSEFIKSPSSLPLQAGVVPSGMLHDYQTVYRVSCAASRDPRRHSAQTYHDMPLIVSEPVESGNDGLDTHIPHINGSAPIHSLDDFIRQQPFNPFIVVKSVPCSDAYRLNSTTAMASWETSLCITSDQLFQAIKSVAKYGFNSEARLLAPNVGYVNNYVNSPQDSEKLYRERQIHAPDLFLYHHRDELAAYAKMHPASAFQISKLLGYAEFTYGNDFKEAELLFEDGLVDEKHYRKLYIPNEPIIIKRSDGHFTGAVLNDTASPIALGCAPACWSLYFNGQGFERRHFAAPKMPVLSSEPTSISDLPILPPSHTDISIIQEMERRGKKQCEHLHPVHVSYTGWNVTKDDYYPDARFMIDLQMYRKMHPDAVAFHSPMMVYQSSPYDKWPTSVTKNAISDLDSQVYLIMPHDTYGFYLTEKRWVNILIDDVEAPRWNKQAFERLVLPSNKKELVKALVTVRTSQRGIKRGLGIGGKREDLISGKGNGLIMLLHGGPGTGKSLTAESVAEIAEMPLYKVTCGDIGTNAASVEKYMTTVLNLGRAWNCVLLLDEADVFLEERSMSDLERNSLVSVFLRILEYYDGILILTSNRVGTFDEAFRSRIQVALHYEPLNRSSRKKVWRNFFDMLEEDEEDADLDELRSHLTDLAEIHVNGRQIRNVLTTARQLAIYRKERLVWEHLEQAIRISADFSSYVKRINGGSADEDWARDSKLR